MGDQTGVAAFPGNIGFNAQHSPMGAFMSFTCGHFGTRGGFGLQAGRPGNQDVYVGLIDGPIGSDGPIRALPFYHGAATEEAARYTQSANQGADPGIVAIAPSAIKRFYGWGSDRWTAGDLDFALFTPFGPIPDTEDRDDLRESLLPAVFGELTLHNPTDKVRTGLFALSNFDAGPHQLVDGLPQGRLGFGFGGRCGVLGQIDAQTIPPTAFIHMGINGALRGKNLVHLLGNVAGLAFEIPPGESRTLRLALGCYLPGMQTTRIEGEYRYAGRFDGLSDVLTMALDRFDDRKQAAGARDTELAGSGLSGDQQFLIAHATRSYYGSTELLDVGGMPFWIVNEGEYRMMNTLDLGVDHVFWELKQNPWVIRNLLDNFVRHYSYVDELIDPKTKKRLPGGLSFCHDMGVNNNFSPVGHSSYELPHLNALCFSHMTAEQLCNWVLMAACYVHATGDWDWAEGQVQTIESCLDSMIHRGGESGLPEYDSSRCDDDGAEITTYDSLDHSLAQTRNNVYMATKSWAAYLGLAMMLEKLGSPLAPGARAGVAKVEKAVLAKVGADGVIPAVFETENPGHDSRILPAVEGLIYPLFWNDPTLKDDSPFVKALEAHTQALLTDAKRRNYFPDGGIRLSSTSGNSWASKISIFMHLARRVFKVGENPAIAGDFAKADAAHVAWQTATVGENGSAYWACSDQIIDGVARGSKYYPRIITSALWME